MAQTATAVNGAAATISIKVGSGSYADISGSSQSVDAVTATVVTGEAYTFDGSYAILTTGKFEPVEVKVNIIYTETAAEAFIVAQAAFIAKSLVQIKWIPLGIAAGADTIESMAGGTITALDYPAIDASSAGPIMVSFTVRAPGITYTVTA